MGAAALTPLNGAMIVGIRITSDRDDIQKAAGQV